MTYRWAPIEDCESLEELAHKELAALADIWRELRVRLRNQQSYLHFERSLRREWAIETGLVERLYTIERGVTQLLIEHGIRTAVIPHGSVSDPGITFAMIEDHEAAVEGLFQFVKDERRLSTSYIKELHALMTRNQRFVEGFDAFGKKREIPLLRGDYKRLPNNPLRRDGSIHEYCPPEHVASEMDRLVSMHLAHDGRIPEAEAAWLHHRFTQIHPFQDGNGRIARALATLLFVKAGWFPLVVRDRDRAQYIAALEGADSGNLRPLVDYFARLQKHEFLRALSLAEDVVKPRRVSDAIHSARQRLLARRDAHAAEWDRANLIADKLRDYAQDRLNNVARELEHEMSDLIEHGEFFADGADRSSPSSRFSHNQIIDTAKKLGYFANMQYHRSWARLVIRNSSQTELLISFHGIGHQFQGILACSATWLQRWESANGEQESSPATPAADELFQINYREPFAEVRARFSDWLEDAIVRALALWQETSI